MFLFLLTSDVLDSLLEKTLTLANVYLLRNLSAKEADVQ